MGRGRRSRTPIAAKHLEHVGRKTASNEEELYALLERTSEPFLLILDCIQDPHNLGACLRTADAAGVHAVIAPKNKSASLTETVRRVSAGGASHVPLIKVTNLARTMDQLKEEGIRIVGTSDQATGTLYQADLTGPLAIAMGFEGTGLRRLTQEKCDTLVNIPMRGKVECLNVSVATGVCLFEAVRQRG